MNKHAINTSDKNIYCRYKQDLEIKEVKKGLMHHVKDVTALQKQMTAMVSTQRSERN